MHVLIDKKRMAIVYRHRKPEVLRALAHLELAHTNVSILEETHKQGYWHFSTRLLQDLFRNLTAGTNPHSNDPQYLIGQIMRLAQTTKEVDVNEFELTTQALRLKPHDKDNYRYVKGQALPKVLEIPYNPPALVGNWAQAQALPLTRPQETPVAPAMAPAAPTIATPWQSQTSTAKIPPPWA